MTVLCKGFKAAGVSAGIKKTTGLDLGLIYSETPATAAGVFTRNLIKAAPVLLDQARLRSGEARAIIVNSGNANCCNGKRGMDDAAAMARSAAIALNIPEALVLTASTGVIGAPMPIDLVTAGVPGLVEALSPEGFPDLALAMTTTDTYPKLFHYEGRIDDIPFNIVGVAKGAGMIHPDMATMLCFVCTDLQVSSEVLSETLKAGSDLTFNRISIDGDTSTNDSILIMANGASGAAAVTLEQKEIFQNGLFKVLDELSIMVVKDGEGASKTVRILVEGARSDRDARIVADSVSESCLVKTAFFGEDANWGRIMMAVGKSGAYVDPDRIDISFDHVKMVENGVGLGDDAEAEASSVLRQDRFTVLIDLRLGPGKADVLTCDLSIDYVKINADYRS